MWAADICVHVIDEGSCLISAESVTHQLWGRNNKKRMAAKDVSLHAKANDLNGFSPFRRKRMTDSHTCTQCTVHANVIQVLQVFLWSSESPPKNGVRAMKALHITSHLLWHFHSQTNHLDQNLWGTTGHGRSNGFFSHDIERMWLRRSPRWNLQ